MSDGAPTLEVGFEIDTGNSFGQIEQLDNMIDRASANAIEEFAKVERASKGMLDLGGATASLRTFGAAATREGQTAARELARVEKAGEALVRSLDRQNAAFGLTKSELRAMKAEAAALAAEQQGLIELAGRIRATEAELFGKEMASARAARIEAENAAEERAMAQAREALEAARQRAAAEAAINAQYLERGRLQAALESNTGVGRMSAVDGGATYSALAAATDRLAREHEELAAAVRGSHAAQMADVDAAERLRMATDPLYAATKRLNDEIAESTRLYHAGFTAPAEYARQQEVLAARLNGVGQAHDALQLSARRGHHTMVQFGMQLNDVATMAALGAPPMQIFASQIGQIVQVAQMAEGGMRGFVAQLGAASKAALLFTVTNPYLVGLAVVATAAAVSIKALQNAANDGADMKAYAASLGLTAKEMRNMHDLTVTYGDTAKAVFQVAGRAIWSGIGPAVTSVWDTMKEWLSWVGAGAKDAINFMIGGFVGAYNIITKHWQMIPKVMGDAFYTAVNLSVEAINAMVRKAVEGMNALIGAANVVLSKVGWDLPTLDAPQIAAVKNQFAGVGEEAREAFDGEMKKAMGVDYIGAAASAIIDQATKNAQDRIRAEAEKKGYLDPDKGKTDKRAERLAREAEAVEAQIRNLYALADAYGVSGAAALIAEARVKAESQAIKQRADIEAVVDRQIRLSVAQRVSDAAKATAAVRDQAEAQSQVNAMVAAGLVPAERAAEMVRDRIADLPILAALEAAQQRGLADEAKRATKSLAEQRAERERLRAEEEKGRFRADFASGERRLAELREELRLVGATERARTLALATLRATQDAETRYDKPENRDTYIRQQVQIADETQRLADATREWNDALAWNADQWDLIARNVSNAARGMADAFGDVGAAIGDMAAIYADFRAEDERARLARDTAILRGASAERENARYALAMSTAQVGLLGDMTSAAKGFFEERSKGYKALATAEKAFRAVEFALSVRAMAQDAIETGSKIATSAARTAAGATEAVVNAIKSLPFPLNLAAGAATVGALASIGVGIAGSFGGGGSRPAPSNEGRGTVMGDPEAQSQSIKRSIDALREVDTLMLSASREMAASLRSIDNQIGGFAALIVRSGNINANGGIAEGFKSDTTGKLLEGIVTGGGLFSKIPVLGGIIGGVGSLLGSLFGSKTNVTASGISGGPQSLGGILGGGFDASYFSDIEKTKKFLGIKTGTSRSTQYTGADAGLEAQFTLILREFNNAIVAAAGPLGAATNDIQNRLNGFVVNIGKIDLKGLTGDQIQEKLTAVFGAAADQMAAGAFPGYERFQKAGEGMFETIVRVASTVEAVTASLADLGAASAGLSVDAKLGIAAQFDSIGDLTSATQAYFERFYTAQEQSAARSAQMQRVFESLGLTMPASLAAFRDLVDVQDLTSAAGQKTYATLLQLAPAFADLQESMMGAKSAADILAERADLERKLLEVQGDTAALRELELAKLDVSNRALQQQIWALQDAQEAARAADELRKAWGSVGDSIMDEVKRIRGITQDGATGGFASLMGQFNAATAAARGGDQDAAKMLPGLSQALLRAAEDQATSRQELNRIQAQTAASLEATFAAIQRLSGSSPAASAQALLSAMETAPNGATSPMAAANDDLRAHVIALTAEVAALRKDNNAGHAATAGNTSRIARKLDDVTAASGGDAISTVAAA